MKNQDMPKEKGPSDYIMLNGKKVAISEHPKVFTVQAPLTSLSEKLNLTGLEQESLGDRTLLRATSKTARDKAMKEIRDEEVAHHVYLGENSNEEIQILDQILLRLTDSNNNELLEEILLSFSLAEVGRTKGGQPTIFLQVTTETGMNPVRVGNLIHEMDGVESCRADIAIELKRLFNPSDYNLLGEQWYHSADFVNDVQIEPNSGINAYEAWSYTHGDPEIVVAVVDDGVDLGHDAFLGKSIHPEARDFSLRPYGRDVTPGPSDFHGTPVASLAIGSGNSFGMVGVAPECTLLPLKIGFGNAGSWDLLSFFQHASRHADVMNCSFGRGPSNFDTLDQGVRDEISEMTRSGGRRGKGLVIVFAAGNDDAPIRLDGPENINGVKFATSSGVDTIEAGQDVYSYYASIPGVIVVAACSSKNRKAGYSNWGKGITVSAPSSNTHELAGKLPDVFGPWSRYRGAGQIAASNRPGFGMASEPMPDVLTTPDIREDFYTGKFGGTSGSAPLVSGVAALMLSVKPDLTAGEVKRILEGTASKDLDFTLDLPDDPNLQELTGEFSEGRSLFFGAGRVDAGAAVRRAASLAGWTSQPSSYHGPSTNDPSLTELLGLFSEQHALFGEMLERFSGESGREMLGLKLGAPRNYFRDSIIKHEGSDKNTRGSVWASPVFHPNRLTIR